MCRRARQCTELGTDPRGWSKFSPLKPPDWFEGQLDIFEQAVCLYVTGDRAACLATLSTIRSDEMRDWYIEHGQMSGDHRARVLALPKPEPVGPIGKKKERQTARYEDLVFQRDGFRCRYCGIRLLSSMVLKEFINGLDSIEFRKGPKNENTHGIACIFRPSADHVLPWSLGGSTGMDNLVASCCPCNFGKGKYTVDQIGIENPLHRDPVVDGWDGLSSLLAGIRTMAK